MPTNGKKKDSLLFAILDVINVLISFSGTAAIIDSSLVSHVSIVTTRAP